MTSLKLTKNKITDEGFLTLLSFLGGNTVLSSISLASNNLTDKSIDVLLNFYNSNPDSGLKKINLCANNNINSKKHKEKVNMFRGMGVSLSIT